MRIKSKSDVLIGDYPFHDKLRDRLVSVLENYPDRQNRASNVKATMTEWNVTTPQIERLKKYVVNEIYKFFPESAIGHKNDKLGWKDFWGNVYRKGEDTISHDHKPSIFSFVYFLKTKWYDSSLVFTDFGERIRPKEGRYVVFPGHILHHVRKHRYNETRITLSGNLFFREVSSDDWYKDFRDPVKLL